MSVKYFSRTSTFAWSPNDLYLVSGSLSGTVSNLDFSNEAQLEIWAPFEDAAHEAVKSSIRIPQRFNRLVWGGVEKSSRPQGLIAAGMENGEVTVYDPIKMLNNEGEGSILQKNTLHKSSVKGLDFNSLQPNVFASGDCDGEIYIWDITNPQKPFSPGSRSRHLNEITSLKWNPDVPHVLATASDTGTSVVWDLKGRKEVITFNDSSSVSSICWQPNNATRLATASDDPNKPAVMIWDLRNSRVPEKVLTGHSKGVTTLDWCKRDPDLLVSGGQDGRSLIWNPSTGQIVGELPPSSNWNVHVEWSPRNPNALAVASLDGTIGIHTLQGTNQNDPNANQISSSKPTDIFDSSAVHSSDHSHPLSLSQTPKWFLRPSSVSFGFGGKLAIVSPPPPPPPAPTNPGQQAPPAPINTSVKLQQAVTETNIVERALALENAMDAQALQEFCDQRAATLSTDSTASKGVESLAIVRSLFSANSREELITLLGFSKEEIKHKVDEAIRSYKNINRSPSQAGLGVKAIGGSAGINTIEKGSPSTTSLEVEDSSSVAKESLVTFAQDSTTTSDMTPSEISTSLVSDNTTKTAEVESEVTEPSSSLFGGDDRTPFPGTGGPNNNNNNNNSVNFYDQIRSAPSIDSTTAEQRSRIASSVAATAGSAPSSVSSDKAMPPNGYTTFKIYPTEESDLDRLVTRALVVGDFESAVSLCLSSGHFADGILLAARSGPDLLARAQKAYFEQNIATSPYLRLFQSIVSHDLSDIVQNADLTEWQEIFVVLCTFSKPDEFPSLVEQLGQRLEYQYSLAHSASASASAEAIAFRKNALVCYLAAGKLEKVVGIWIDEMKEDEELITSKAASNIDAPKQFFSKSTGRANALQTFIEKVTIFQASINYSDTDLNLVLDNEQLQSLTLPSKAFKLAPLYDCYLEYADLLASQGLLSSAYKYVDRVPKAYRQLGKDADGALAKSRLVSDHTQPKMHPISSAVPSTGHGRQQEQQQQYQPYQQQTSAYAPTAAPTNNAASSLDSYNPYVPHPAPVSQPLQQQQQQPPSQGHPYGAPSYPSYQQPLPPQQQQQQHVPPPPPPGSSRKESNAGGWNDAPMLSSTSRRSATPSNRPNAITSPFPNSNPAGAQPGQYPPPPPSQPSYGGHPQQQAPPPPPPPPMHPPSRTSTRTPSAVSQAAYRPQVPTVSPPTAMHAQPPLPPQQQQQQQPPPGPGPYAPPPQQQQPPPQQQGPRPVSRGPQPPPPHGQNVPPVPPIPPPQQQQQTSMYGQQQQPGTQPPMPPGQSMPQPHPAPPGPYDPPPQQQAPPQQPQQQQAPRPISRGPPGHPPQQQGGAPPPLPHPPAGPGGPIQRPPSTAQTPQQQPPQEPPKPQPPQPKYPPGDRSHISESQKPIFNILSHKVNSFKSSCPPQQKRMADDTERRLNILFDHLNCGTIEDSIADKILAIAKAIEGKDQSTALNLHLQLLQSAGSDRPYIPALKVIAQRCADLA